MRTVQITKNDAEQRVDKFLQKYFKNMPLSLIYKYIRKKRVKLNGKRSFNNTLLKEGDILTLYIEDKFFDNCTASTINGAKQPFKAITPCLDIVYEDDNILIVDKKPGMLSHADKKVQTDTLIMHIQSYLYHKKSFIPQNENTFKPAICNRLDRNTGGLVIAAKTAEALRIMNEKIKLRQVHKFYLCHLQGILADKQGTLEGYLTKDNTTNKAYITKESTKDSKGIETKYHVLQEKNDMSLVEVQLITGRSHQIRAHFAAIGHPLIGDIKYGGKKVQNLTHQALYAYKLVFDFPNEESSLRYLHKKTVKVPTPYSLTCS